MLHSLFSIWPNRYDYERALQFNKEIRRLGTVADGSSFLDQVCFHAAYAVDVDVFYPCHHCEAAPMLVVHVK